MLCIMLIHIYSCLRLHVTLQYEIQHGVDIMMIQLKAELEEMEQQGIIVSVTTPTAWVSSMVVVPKKNGKLRICLDPKDLNRAIQREHYPLPTIEDVATRLHGSQNWMPRTGSGM